jgi:hypothetical protein
MKVGAGGQMDVNVSAFGWHATIFPAGVVLLLGLVVVIAAAPGKFLFRSA